MIENVEIGTKELRFIYKLIVDGWSDSDISNKYNSLVFIGDLNCPLRTNEAFIKDRRKEIEIASEVLRESISTIIEKYTLMRGEGHFAQIAEVSTILLQDNLNTVRLNKNVNEVTHRLKTKYVYSDEYTIKGGNNIPIRLNKLQLTEMFRKNVEEAIKRYGISFFHDCYVPHLKAIMNEGIEVKGGFWPSVEIKPFEVIKAVMDILSSKKLYGTCPLCGVENQLSTFIKSTFKDTSKFEVLQ